MSKQLNRGGSKPKPQPKRKRDEVEEDDAEFSDGSEDSLDFDALVDGDEDEDDDASEDDIELDAAEEEIMQAMQAKKKNLMKKRSSADMQDDDDEDEDAEEDEDGAEFIGGDSSEDDGEEAADEGTGRIARPALNSSHSKRPQKLPLTAEQSRALANLFAEKMSALVDQSKSLDTLQREAATGKKETLPWVYTLQLTTKKTFAEVTGNAEDAAQDDLKREAAFYELSLQSASEGLQQLTDLGIPFRIPPDFYAERVKPDRHMNRIKDKLIEEQQKMLSVASRKKDKETRKFASSVQSASIQAKNAEKKLSLQKASLLRKKMDSKGEGVELGVERSLLPGINTHLQANRADDAARAARKSAKRAAKDSKYGFGGKKKRIKVNDKESTRKEGKMDMGKIRQNFQGFKDQKPGSFQDRRSSSGKSGSFNRNGSGFSAKGGKGGGAGRGSGGSGGGFSSKSGAPQRGGKGGRSVKAKPNRPGKNSRAQSRK